MEGEDEAPAPPWAIALYFGIVTAAVCVNAWLLPRILPTLVLLHSST